MSPTVDVEGFAPFEVPRGRTLLEACELGGVPMLSECGGFAACNSCRVRLLDDGSGLTPLVGEEEPFLDRGDQRLGCQARVIGPVRVRLDPGS